MFCTQCGVALEDHHKYCWQCGKGTVATPAPAGHTIYRQRLVRVMAEKQIAGVCAGFARYFDMDIVLVRVIWLLTAIFTGVGFIAYIIAWIAMPKDTTYLVPAPQRT